MIHLHVGRAIGFEIVDECHIDITSVKRSVKYGQQNSRSTRTYCHVVKCLLAYPTKSFYLFMFIFLIIWFFLSFFLSFFLHSLLFYFLSLK